MQQHKCYLCGNSLDHTTNYDHVVPKTLGGSNIEGGCNDTAPSYEACLELWLDLLSYCTNGDVDSKIFKSKQDNINRVYKRMSYQEQGMFHKLVAQELRRVT